MLGKPRLAALKVRKLKKISIYMQFSFFFFNLFVVLFINITVLYRVVKKVLVSVVGHLFPGPKSLQFPYLYGKLSANPKYSPGTDFDQEIQYPGN